MVVNLGTKLTIAAVISVARRKEKVVLSKNAILRIRNCKRQVDKIIRDKKVVYGISTGIGDLWSERVPLTKLRELQRNIVRSHATGVGPLLPDEVVRAAMLLLANSLSKGYSGVRPELVQTLGEMLNCGVHPLVPAQGSVGASGDLAPLSHIALVLIGESKAVFGDAVLSGKDAMKAAGLQPLELEPKEGVALLNGTHVMTALAALATHDAEELLKNAQLAAAMSVEALKGTHSAFNEKLQKLRPHSGQVEVAANMRAILKNSEIAESHRDCPKVQDAYALRCIPQVLGAVRDCIGFAKGIIETELNSVTDNPLIFPNGKVISGGNFHGENIGLVCELLGMAIAELGSIAERRVFRLLNSQLSGLPPFLAVKSGLNSGLMLTQYTAAALVSENKVLAHPAVVDSIPTSAWQEDFVSMATISARKAGQILNNARKIIAIEFLCAAQGLEFLKPLKPGIGVRAAYERLRKTVPALVEDRPLYPDIEALEELIASRELSKAVEKKIAMNLC